MDELDAARLDLHRATERYLRAAELMPAGGLVSDVVAVARYTADGEAYGRGVLGARGLDPIPLELACDLLEEGFHAAWDQRPGR